MHMRGSIFAILAGAVLRALHAAVIAIAVLLLAVGFGAFASLPLRTFGGGIFPQRLKAL